MHADFLADRRYLTQCIALLTKGHLLLSVPRDVSPLELRTSSVGRPIRQDESWYDQRPWSTVPIPAGRYRLRFPVPFSSDLTFDEQKGLLLKDEEAIPLVLAEIVLLSFRFLGYDDPLEGAWLRCREPDGAGNVLVGWREKDISVSSWGPFAGPAVLFAGCQTIPPPCPV